MAFCDKCDEEITWAETANGKNVALEPVEEKDTTTNGYGALMYGNLRVRIVLKGKDAWATKEDSKLHRQLFVCHWDVCEG
jgi:hypothetical protein